MPLTLGKHLARTAWLAVALVLITGCSSTGCCLTLSSEQENYTRHYVIGFGVVDVGKAENATAARVFRSTNLGVSYTHSPLPKFNLGYVHSQSVTIPDGAEDVRIEVRSDGERLTVDAACARMNNTNQKGECND